MASADSLVLYLKGEGELTPAAKADYGFDPSVYILTEAPIPTQNQTQALVTRLQDFTPKELHNALVGDKGDGLRSLLGEGFYWVRNVWDL
jgi:hypothetical protein